MTMQIEFDPDSKDALEEFEGTGPEWISKIKSPLSLECYETKYDEFWVGNTGLLIWSENDKATGVNFIPNGIEDPDTANVMKLGPLNAMLFILGLYQFISLLEKKEVPQWILDSNRSVLFKANFTIVDFMDKLFEEIGLDTFRRVQKVDDNVYCRLNINEITTHDLLSSTKFGKILRKCLERLESGNVPVLINPMLRAKMTKDEDGENVKILFNF